MQLARNTVVILNGPLGIGKSTLTEALSERIEHCVALDGDHLIALHPPPENPAGYLHSTLLLLMEHHRQCGYRHFIINHFWRDPSDLADLCRRLQALDAGMDVRCFLLTLPLEENLRRIERRRAARALDETEFEDATVLEERRALEEVQTGLGYPLDVSPPLSKLVAVILERLGRA